jgi:hypothetical protein
METAEHREPCESRGSCTDLGAPGGAIPPGDSPADLRGRRKSAPPFRQQYDRFRPAFAHGGGYAYRWQASLPSRFARAALAKRNATAAVIGAGDFIGSAIAKKFAAEGFTIFAGTATRSYLRNRGHEFPPSDADRHLPSHPMAPCPVQCVEGYHAPIGRSVTYFTGASRRHHRHHQHDAPRTGAL